MHFRTLIYNYENYRGSFISSSSLESAIHQKHFFVYILDDIYQEVKEQIKGCSDLKANCLGGGRINHDPDKKTIQVYGYSQVIKVFVNLFI